MKKLFMILPLVLLLCFTFGCQKSEEVAEEAVVDVEADVEAIKALLDEFDALMNAGDTEKLVSQNYADAAVRMPPNEPMLKGKAEILAWFQKGAEQYTYQIDNVIVDVKVDGNLAYSRGIASGTRTLKAGGEAYNIKSKWMAAYERQADGSWRVIADIFNSDNPLPEEKD